MEIAFYETTPLRFSVGQKRGQTVCPIYLMLITLKSALDCFKNENLIILWVVTYNISKFRQGNYPSMSNRKEENHVLPFTFR